MNATLKEVYDRLFAAYGPQKWWPGESPFEVLVGAVLVQNTSWKNVERAIANLRQARLMEPHALYAAPPEELEELIRPAGYYRVKARRLRSLLSLLVDRYDGDLDRMFRTRLPSLREELLSVNGIGPETADSILLYAGELPAFVVDTYTYRVLARHGWIGFDAGYDENPRLFSERDGGGRCALQRIPRAAGPRGPPPLQQDASVPRLPVVRSVAAVRPAGTGVRVGIRD